MGIISEIFNFDNIGGKIKALAKWSCWITILLTWVGAIISFFILLFTNGTFFIAFLVPIAAALSSLLVWIGSWVIYAFGEHIEDTKSISYDTTTISQSTRKAEAEKVQQKPDKQPTSPKPIETAKRKIVPARTDSISKTAYAEGEYVSGRTYDNGDIVIFEGKKYSCVVSKTVWNPSVSPSHWQELTTDEAR